jgi:hypothetical protein
MNVPNERCLQTTDFTFPMHNSSSHKMPIQKEGDIRTPKM